jgi:hypothetical protein
MSATENRLHELMLPHEALRLHITATNFYIEPVDVVVRDVLVIDRVTHEILLSKNEGRVPADAEIKQIYGIVGVIRLLAGPYLIVITRREKVGEIDQRTIWKITGTEVISYQRTLLHLNEQQLQDNARYLSMIETILGFESYYFSTTFDLTHSLQRLSNTSPDFKHLPLHERADTRFMWNGFVLRDLMQQPELSRFCLPVIHGFVNINDCCIKGRSFRYIIVSRRSCYRAGTRYNTRGIDAEGHVANFVETEQIVEYGTLRCSFVQTRGSVPLFWNQLPDLSYKPRPVISTTQDHLDAFKRHFDTQIYHYGRQVIINLLDQKGHEQRLVENYGQMVASSEMKQIRYVPFDFHKECKAMKWYRLSLLMDKIDADLNQFGYFMSQDLVTVSLQSGVFRTNCIDCLDRTNVVQSMLAARVLESQLVKLGILVDGERLQDQASFDTVFKNTWADNADVCAKQYAGTGALKTDFTRTGRRTKAGLLRDGWNSLVRYVINNFYDGFRQDAMDLFLGHYEVEASEGITKVSPLRQERDWKFYALPAVFMVAFSMCVISVLIPDEHLSEQVMYILFWGGASAISLGSIYYYGKVFVNRPKLVPEKLKTE